MRPDLDDYDELSIGDGSSRARAMSWLVLLVAIGGFTSLAYYAYKSGSQAMHESAVTVVAADDAPIKTAPEDPQGEQFPNKDKTIYDAIAAQDGKGQRVEKLMPGPEQPVIPDPEDDGPVADNEAATKSQTTTYVNEVGKASDPVDAQSVKKGVPAPAVTPAPSKPAPAVTTPEKTANSPTITTSEDAGSEAASPEKSASAPEMVNVKPVTSTSKPTSEVKDAEAKPVKATKPEKAPAVAVATGGSYKIQLGAFQSEEEARAQWKKISGKHSDVVTGSPIIEKTENAKGTFYRLRASGFASAAAAKIACTTLAARHQACFPVGK